MEAYNLTREDILSAAREDKERGKEFESKVSFRSGFFAALIALVVGFLLVALQYWIERSVNYGLIAVGVTAAAADALYVGIKFHKIGRIVYGSIIVLIALLAVMMFINGLVIV